MGEKRRAGWIEASPPKNTLKVLCKHPSLFWIDLVPLCFFMPAQLSAQLIFSHGTVPRRASIGYIVGSSSRPVVPRQRSATRTVNAL